MTTDVDLVIVGGGMVGAALAATLDEHFRVAVVEAGQPFDFDVRDDVDLRVSALSAASQTLLRSVGAWPAIEQRRASPFRRMHVWDAGSAPRSAQALRFDSAGAAEPALGTIVENRLVQWALGRCLASRRNVDWIAPARVTGIDFGRRRARVTLDDGRRLGAALVVGADGAASPSRALAGLETVGYDYDQRAVVAHVSCTHDHEKTAWQRFLPDGPLALLPLADGRCSIVWSTAPAHAERLLAMDDAAFGAAVTDGSDRVLGDLRVASARAAFPLRLAHAPRYVRPRFALVGDAAHSVHPLAGQGVNLGFLDAAALAEVLTHGCDAGHDAGDLAVLRRYERWRKGENLAAMALLDGLGRLFASTDSRLVTLRRFGLGLVTRLTPLRETLARRAMGLEGDLPARVLRS